MPLTKTQTDLLNELLVATETQSTGDMATDIDTAMETVVTLMNALDTDNQRIDYQGYTPELSNTIQQRMSQLTQSSDYTLLKTFAGGMLDSQAQEALADYPIPQILKDSPIKLVNLVENRDQIFNAVETLKAETTSILEETVKAEEETIEENNAEDIQNTAAPQINVSAPIITGPNVFDLQTENQASAAAMSIGQGSENGITLEAAQIIVEKFLISTGAELQKNGLINAKTLEKADGEFGVEDDMALQTAMVFLSDSQYGIGFDGGNAWEFSKEKSQYFIDNYEGSALHKTLENKRKNGEEIEALDAQKLSIFAESLAVLDDHGKLSKEKYDAVPDTLMAMSGMNIESFLPIIANVFNSFPFLSSLQPFIEDLLSTLTGTDVDLGSYTDNNSDSYEDTYTNNAAPSSDDANIIYTADDTIEDSTDAEIKAPLDTPTNNATQEKSSNVNAFNNAADNSSTQAQPTRERVFNGGLTHAQARAIYQEHTKKDSIEYHAKASPVVDKDALAEGRIVLHYLDVAMAQDLRNKIQEQNILAQANKEADKNLSNASKMLKENKEKIARYTETGDQENIDRYTEKLPRLEQDILEAKENIRVSKEKIEELQEWIDDPAHYPYKNVDVTQEMQNAHVMDMNNYNMAPKNGETAIEHTARVTEILKSQRENFPNFSKILEQHEKGIYQEIGDISTLINFVEQQTDFKEPSNKESSKRTQKREKQYERATQARTDKPEEVRTWRDSERERDSAARLRYSQNKDKIKSQKADKKDATKDWKKSDNIIEDAKDLRADQEAHAAELKAAAPSLEKLEKFYKANPKAVEKPEWVEDIEKTKAKLDKQGIELDERQASLFEQAAENRYIKRTEFDANKENVTGFSVGDKKVDFVVDPKATTVGI